jgi:hypothetical protein
VLVGFFFFTPAEWQKNRSSPTLFSFGYGMAVTIFQFPIFNDRQRQSQKAPGSPNTALGTNSPLACRLKARSRFSVTGSGAALRSAPAYYGLRPSACNLNDRLW